MSDNNEFRGYEPEDIFSDPLAGVGAVPESEPEYEDYGQWVDFSTQVRSVTNADNEYPEVPGEYDDSYEDYEEFGGLDSEKGNQDFMLNYDFDGEYEDADDPAPIRPRRIKRTGIVGGILYALFILCVSLILASLLWLAVTDVFGFGKESRSIEITIPDNFDADTVSDILYENNLIKYKWLFKLYLSFSHSIEDKIASGTYQVLSSYDYFALVNGLTPDSGILVETDLITIPEGFTLKEIFELLEANQVCSADALWECAATYDFDYFFLDSSTLGEKLRLEGYLFPDSYVFYVNDKPEQVIDKFLSNFEDKFNEEYIARAEELGLSIKDIVTVASLIEEEAAGDDERDLIASVIYNRLDHPDWFPCLQIDAAINYAVSFTGEEFSLDVDSPYNTYTHEGLTPTPIANPGIASIRAALYPQDTSYYYYALSIYGTHEFFSSESGFINFVESDEYGG